LFIFFLTPPLITDGEPLLKGFKKVQERLILSRNRKKTSNAFFSLKTRFFCPENGARNINVNHVDLIVSFLWPRRTPQSEFPIKSYDRLKLRWSDFGFYFCLFSLFFLSSFSLFLSHLSFYIWKQMKSSW
jgi:hypothetical protein